MTEEPVPHVLMSQDLLKSLVDEEPCEFDHHGGCQAHGYLSLEPGELCPQYEAAQLLAADPPVPTAAIDAVYAELHSVLWEMGARIQPVAVMKRWARYLVAATWPGAVGPPVPKLPMTHSDCHGRDCGRADCITCNTMMAYYDKELGEASLPTPAHRRAANPDSHDVYVRVRNVLREGLTSRAVSEDVIIDWSRDGAGAEHVVGVEVLGARGVEIDGLRVVVPVGEDKL